MKEYFMFREEKDARQFFIDCLEKGIVVAFSRENSMYCVEIDIEQTLNRKNN